MALQRVMVGCEVASAQVMIRLGSRGMGSRPSHSLSLTPSPSHTVASAHPLLCTVTSATIPHSLLHTFPLPLLHCLSLSLSFLRALPLPLLCGSSPSDALMPSFGPTLSPVPAPMHTLSPVWCVHSPLPLPLSCALYHHHGHGHSHATAACTSSLALPCPPSPSLSPLPLFPCCIVLVYSYRYCMYVE